MTCRAASRRRQRTYERLQSTPVPAAQPHASGPSPTAKWAMSAETRVIANPAYAPYGRAAEDALRKRGLWNRIQPALVLGENVTQAAQFATTGSAVGGIVAYSLALAPAMQDKGTHHLIPATDHGPLRQRMVLLKSADPIAERFYRYLQQPAARAILARYGFSAPD